MPQSHPGIAVVMGIWCTYVSDNNISSRTRSIVEREGHALLLRRTIRLQHARACNKSALDKSSTIYWTQILELNIGGV